MRRFAAVMNHRSAGFKANAMGVWAVPDEQLEAIGPQMAGFAAVSHCYRRPTYDDWPYSVFTMVHGRSARDCEATIDAIRTETGIDEYCLLWSIKEYKKVRVQLLHARVGRLARTRPPRRRRVTPPGRNPPRPTTRPRPRRRSTAARLFAGGGDASRSPPRWCAAATQPASLIRSLATTHGYARYGTTAGGASPRPLLHNTWSMRSAASYGQAGHVAAGQERVGVLVRQPTVGRDVEHAIERLLDREEQRARDVVDVHDLHGRCERPQRDGRMAGRGGREHASLRAGADDRRDAQTRRRRGRRVAAAHSASIALALGVEDRREVPGIRAQHGASSVIGTGLFSHAPYTAALDGRMTRRTPARAAASSTTAGPVAVHADHQRLVEDRPDDRREVHHRVDVLQDTERDRH